MASLDTIPAELVAGVTELLTADDLTRLARVSKRFCGFARSVLWRSIELHRMDAHHGQLILDVQQKLPRAYLDDELRDEWSYRTPWGNDPDFDRRNAKFCSAIKKLYRTAGRSQAWVNLAPVVRHICITITHKSPLTIWNAILSLPNLATVEVVGEASKFPEKQIKFPLHLNGFRAPAAVSVRNARLRGYNLSEFIIALCKASANCLVSLDVGTLEEPRVWTGDSEDTDFEEEYSYTIFCAPQAPLWYSSNAISSLQSLKHLLLCRRGVFETLPDFSEEEDFEYREDEGHHVAELTQWASLLKSVRNTVEEIVLEQRTMFMDYVLDVEIGPSPKEEFDGSLLFPEDHTEDMVGDARFIRHVLKAVDDGGGWPKLSRVTFKGINLSGFDKLMGESLEAFVARVFPGAHMKKMPGHQMFFNPRTGAVKNEHGVDGLKPQLDFQAHFGYDDFAFDWLEFE